MATTTGTLYAHITKDPEVCGGKACIDGTRIRVMDIVALVSFAAVIAATVFVILDLEYPRRCFIRVDAADQALSDLRRSME